MSRRLRNPCLPATATDAVAARQEIAAILATGLLRLARRCPAESLTPANLPSLSDSSQNPVDDAEEPWLHVQRVNAPESAPTTGART